MKAPLPQFDRERFDRERHRLSTLHAECVERAGQLELPFSAWGIDPFGVDRAQIARFYTLLGLLYRHYLRVRVCGMEHVPSRGRAMMVGNHSGGVALDAGMVLASTFFECQPPRLAQGMAEKFLNRFPFASSFTSRLGHFTGLPEHALRMLREERLLMVFPEGARGTAKLYSERDSLVRFGTGFMRLAMQTQSPVVPFAFVGGGEAIPTLTNLYTLGKLLGVPYVPITPWVLPLPLPVEVVLIYGKPMHFSGTGHESDAVVQTHVDQVSACIARLIRQGRMLREKRIRAEEVVFE